MELIVLILYGGINIVMVATCLHKDGALYQFPFWAGILALGWFFPQAVGSYANLDQFPQGAFYKALFFASLCTLVLWAGYAQASGKTHDSPSWLDAQFEIDKLYRAGAALCAFGFFFQWKVWSLPEEVLSETQWSGAAVKYLFLASVFKFGFLALWLLYLSQSKLVVPRLLIFIIPSVLCLLYVAFVMGRRATMMDLVAYLIVSIWFVRRKTIPRWAVISGIFFGMVLINGIGTYRAIMIDGNLPLSERFAKAFKADYTQKSEQKIDKSHGEFKNYLYSRQVYADERAYDYGGIHWNTLIFNYVPGQIVGQDLKKSLMVPETIKWTDVAMERYGHRYATGATSTGYSDSFGSFGWFGFIKFWFVGLIMGTLYRHAMGGAFFGQLLYVYTLGTAMHVVSHGTNRILLSSWVYFFMLAYPIFYIAKLKRKPTAVP